MKYKNIILGGGVVGLIAKKLLGDDWTLIPFGRSRFYSFVPALADNFIIRDPKIDDVVEYLGGKPKYLYKIRYSLNGDIFDYTLPACDVWLNKVFAGDPPPHASAYLKSRCNFTIYDLRVNELYTALQNEFKDHIVEQDNLGLPTEVGDHYFIRNGERYEFEQCISTIPLNALLKLCNSNMQLDANPCWIFHIQTEHLDFEGCNQLYVVDEAFDFYKATNIGPDRYIIYCNKEIYQPGPYFMRFMRRFDMLDGTVIPDAIIQGPKKDLKELNKLGIECIGSYAEWDWCADVGSCIMKLLRYRQSN